MYDRMLVPEELWSMGKRLRKRCVFPLLVACCCTQLLWVKDENSEGQVILARVLVHV